MNPRRAWILAAAILAVVYLATMAVGVTFWDAGEFIAAAHALGVPHPPGTPLFVMLLHTWALPWTDATYALATNSFSVLCTVGAAAASAALIAQWMDSGVDRSFAFVAAVAAAVCAGTMSTVWSNATETEVYAASLALAMAMIYAGDRAGRARDRRWRSLVAYCFGLAAPLHISALVAAPAAVMLAATGTDGVVDRAQAAALLTGAVLVMAIGTLSPIFGIATLLVGCGALVMASRAKWSIRATASELAWILGLALLGATPLVFMLLRAGFDPAINQGNPSTLRALLDVVSRRQYAPAALWPRRAPFWIQLANWFEYADWQAALSLGPTVIPTVLRVLASVTFGALAIVGASAHRRIDPRSWRALIVLFVCGSIGVVVYLNMLASPSFGWGVLAPNADHEARERDYFFVLGFWTLGLWAGIGAVALARRRQLPLGLGAAAAALTIVLNWNAVNRRGTHESSLPTLVAHGVLDLVPKKSVLFVAGDNDTYPIWYAQEVLGLRRDVTVVTLPLLGAGWYLAEIQRRNPTLRWPVSRGDPGLSIADAARRSGRPVVAALTLTAADRSRLRGCWTVIGFASVDRGMTSCEGASTEGEQPASLDSISTARWVNRFSSAVIGAEPEPSIDPIRDYFARMLQCPSRLLDSARKNGPVVSLDSTCNP